jgi:hypothetical protein
MDKPIQIILVLGNSNIDIMKKRLDRALVYYHKLSHFYNTIQPLPFIFGSNTPNNTNNFNTPTPNFGSVNNNVNNSYLKNIFFLVSGKGIQKPDGDGKQISETDFMYDYLVKSINKDNIIKENNSMTTYESIFNSFKMIKDIFDSNTQLSTSITNFGKPIKNYIYINICTSTFHLKRTMLICNYIILKNNLTINNSPSCYYYYFQNENIYLNNFNVKYIHTNEIPTHEQTSKELSYIDNFLSECINNDMIL